MLNSWISGTVLEGDQTGRQQGFPTINFDPSLVAKIKPQEGIYAAWVEIDGQTYKGALYYGPRITKNETAPVLEIFILDFSGDLYGTTVRFRPVAFIRGIKNFSSQIELEKAIDKDVEDVQAALNTPTAD